MTYIQSLVRTACVLLPLVAWCFAAPGRVLAQSIHYVSQERRIEASNTERYFQNDPPDYVTRSDTKMATAPDFGPFDAAVSASAGGYSTISEHSTLRPDGISTAGEWSNYAATDNGVFSFNTLADAMFEVSDAPVRFDFAYSLRDPSTRGFAHQTDLFLKRLDGEGGDVFRVTPQFDPDLYTASGTESGTLPAGRYELRYFNSYLGDVGEFGRYDVQLTFSGMPEPASVGFVLIGGGLVALRRRRSAM